MSNTVAIDDLPEELQEVAKALNQSLEPLEPSEGIELFLDKKSSDISPQTVTEYERKLENLRQFCKMKDIGNLNDFNGRNINEYRRWRRSESADQSEPLAPKTMRDELYLLKSFLRFLEGIEAVVEGSSEKVDIPKLDEGEGVRDTNLDPDRVETILEHLDKYEHASRAHVTWLFFAQVGRRPGGLYALDLEDAHLDCEDPYIEFTHRPPETTLKNKSKSEGEVAIFEPFVTILREYIENNRIEVTTENGRQPLLTSQVGRLSRTSTRRYIYKYSRPCAVGEACPHDRDPESCDAAQPGGEASTCPSSRSPYSLRHGYITAKKDDGVPVAVLCDRCDTSETMIDKHYDEGDDEEKRARRTEVLKEQQAGSSGGGY